MVFFLWSTEQSLVRIHKKRKLDESDSSTSVPEQKTPEKNNGKLPEDTPEKLR